MSGRPPAGGGDRQHKKAPRSLENVKIMHGGDGTEMEEAEASLFQKIEEGRQHARPGMGGFRAAVKGETAPLGNKPLGKAFDGVLGEGETEGDGKPAAAAKTAPAAELPPKPSLAGGLSGKMRFRAVANQVRQMQTASSLVKQLSQRSQQQPRKHRRVASLLASINDDEDEDDDNATTFLSGPPKPPMISRRPSAGSHGSPGAGKTGPGASVGSPAPSSRALERTRSFRHQRRPSNLNQALHGGTLGNLLMDFQEDDFDALHQTGSRDSATTFSERPMGPAATWHGTGDEEAVGAMANRNRTRSWSISHHQRTSSAETVQSETRPLLQPGSDDAPANGYGNYHQIVDALPTQNHGPKEMAGTILMHLEDFFYYIVYYIRVFFYLFFHSTLPLALMCCIASWILFYKLHNPEFDFMPGRARLSWWLNFVARQFVTFEMARILQWVFVDWFALGTRWGSRLLGPLLIIVLVQSKGGPFLITMWGLLDTILIHGDNPFQVHWLYWTGIKIYSSANSGLYVLDSDEYTRFLFVLILTGVAATTKRTYVTLYFGRRNFDIYKDKLEKILRDIIVVSEIADLAEEASKISDVLPMIPTVPTNPTGSSGELKGTTASPGSSSGSLNMSAINMDENEQQVTSGNKDLVAAGTPARKDAKSIASENLKNKGRAGESLQTVRWQSVKFSKKGGNSLSRSSSLPDDDSSTSSASSNDSLDDAGTAEGAADARRSLLGGMRRSYSRDSTNNLPIKKLLDRWTEPTNKADQTTHASIHDVYKFRKALAYMDMEHPFAESFGPATKRDECITSAQNVYKKLLKLSPAENMLSFEVLAVLCNGEDGMVDHDSLRTMRRLFRPDKNGMLSMLAFVQSCDNVYKKLRYFRASVGNSSVIDGVLEGIITFVFQVGMILVLLSIMKFNPWPLLVSMSTLMVTFAFAVGPSTAKAIEGILLIVLRRPYDIGDRIVISDNPGTAVMENEAKAGWFVEDITLFSTTLRHAPSNIVATLSNGSLSTTRITNCARSPSAIIAIDLKLSIKIHDEDYIHQYVKGIERYVSDHPRLWESMLFFRCEEINEDFEYVVYKVCCRSRHTWQVAARILEDRAALRKHCEILSRKLNVVYSTPEPTRLYFYGGEKRMDANGKMVIQQPTNALPPSQSPPANETATRSRGFTEDNNNFLNMIKNNMY